MFRENLEGLWWRQVMELQQAEGKITLTFIRSKCFVKFFVYSFPPLSFNVFYCFYYVVFNQRPLAGLVPHSIPVIPWHCTVSQSQSGVNRSLSCWVGRLIDCETLDIWWLCVGMYHSRECRGLGSWPLNQPLTPYRLHRSLCPDGLKHFIVLPVTACAFSGVLLRMKNVRFTVGADVRCVTVLPNM